MRNVVHLIEAKEKSIKNLTDEMRQHAVLLEKRRAAEVERGKLMAQWNTLQAERATLKEKRENRSRLFRELLNSVVEQRHQYVMIIKKFSASKDAVLSDLDFEAELRFDRDKLLWAIEDLADNRRVQIVRADRTPAVCDRATEALQRVACGDEGDIDATVGEVDGLAERLKPNLKTARTGTVLDLYRVLYQSYLTVRPTARYKRTSLDRLSLGQKATVLIKIYLAEGDEPIIIDSHDDHLDNEFIMDELVGAIRQARNFRQVIVASNNGNVVVNSDADQVIVAHRREGEISYLSGAMEAPEIRTRALGAFPISRSSV